VHDAILEDLCYPSEIVGKRIRIKLDGTRLIKVHLDKAQQTNVEHKVNSVIHVHFIVSLFHVSVGALSGLKPKTSVTYFEQTAVFSWFSL